MPDRAYSDYEGDNVIRKEIFLNLVKDIFSRAFFKNIFDKLGKPSVNACVGFLERRVSKAK